MGCVSSKLVKKELVRDIRLNNGGDHIVSLTSTTYGLLKLDNSKQHQEQEPMKKIAAEPKKSSGSPPREEPEIINAWELMKDLEEGMPVSKNLEKISPKSRVLFGISRMSPLKLLDKIDSPKKGKRFGGKENKVCVNGFSSKENRGCSPKNVLKPKNLLETPEKGVLRLSFPVKTEDSASCHRRKSFSPLFDPELVASYERELCDEREQIKMIISPAPEIRKPIKTQESEKILKNFEQKCPPRGENSVVIYTTTLRGIRKTFEDCNTVRSIIESHQTQVLERDVSMHSAFKEEVKGIMGTKELKVPVVFIKGRLIGGVDEVVKLEEEGKLGILLEGIPKGHPRKCQGCGGLRFVMCIECNGSCKVRDEDGKKIATCGDCNENGLILCPICC